MPLAHVEWYNPEKGYGFLRCARTRAEIYVDESLLAALGLHVLAAGQVVHYEAAEENGLRCAITLRLAAKESDD